VEPRQEDAIGFAKHSGKFKSHSLHYRDKKAAQLGSLHTVSRTCMPLKYCGNGGLATASQNIGDTGREAEYEGRDFDE
jgi:hypothetical protein